MYKSLYTLFTLFILASLSQCIGQEKKVAETYVYKNGSRDGIGKWYMGREIAHVMGFQGIRWLERPEREKEENTAKLLLNMNIQPEDTIADIGAGAGYHVFKMAEMAHKAHAYAVDIQDEMLEAIQTKIKESGSQNITTVKGSEESINLIENSVDKILMVDVYHEFNFPVEIMASVSKALRTNGKLYLIDYRSEDATVPIKKLHKMTAEQAVKEMKAAGFKLDENIDNLPWQHCMVFSKV